MAKDSPESRSEILKLASEYLKNETPGKAIKLLENAEIPDEDTELQHLLAVAYADRKWGKKAILQYRKCISCSELSPSVIQDYSEFMLDSGEHTELTDTLCCILERDSISSEAAAMCVAMIYAALGDCKVCGISSSVTPDFLKEYIDKHPEASDTAFFTSVMKNLSLTPNDASITSLTNHVLKIMADAVPSVLRDNGFQNAVADFEISIMLYSNTVTPVSILGMRTAKLRFAAASDDADYLRYLVFDAKMAVVDAFRTGRPDTSKFAETYPYLWSLISKFVTGVSVTPDLRKFTRDEIYSDLKNASPRLKDIFRQNLSADGFEALKNFIEAPASAPKPAVFSGNRIISRPASVKASPNEPCPCGSGKKFKKCCGLK